MTIRFQILGVESGNENEVALDALEKFFAGDLIAAHRCYDEYKDLLDHGDDNAEHGNHRWADAEREMVSAIEQNCKINESKWSGISVFWE